MRGTRLHFTTLRQLGFSLMELIVVIVVLGILASVGSTVLRDGFLGYLRGREISSTDWQGRLALERITRELRYLAAPNYSNIGSTSCSSSTFTFIDITNANISYTQSGTTLMRNGQPLASNVTGLSFSCLKSDVTPTVTLSSVYYITVSMIVATTNTRGVYRSTVKPGSF